MNFLLQQIVGSATGALGWWLGGFIGEIGTQFLFGGLLYVVGVGCAAWLYQKYIK